MLLLDSKVSGDLKTELLFLLRFVSTDGINNLNIMLCASLQFYVMHTFKCHCVWISAVQNKLFALFFFICIVMNMQEQTQDTIKQSFHIWFWKTPYMIKQSLNPTIILFLLSLRYRFGEFLPLRTSGWDQGAHLQTLRFGFVLKGSRDGGRSGVIIGAESTFKESAWEIKSLWFHHECSKLLR